MKRLTGSLIAIVALLPFAGESYARISISPYASIRSSKSIKPGEAGKEDSKTKQHQEYGIKGSVSFWRLLKFQVGIGQSEATQVTKTQDAADEYGEIDYEKDLNLDTSDPEADAKIREVQKLGRATLIFDPGFWIFVARFKAGVTATQRELQLNDGPVQIFPPTYKPHSGVGLGVKMGRKASAMVEYNFLHYKFPEIEPFEREVSVSFSLNL